MSKNSKNDVTDNIKPDLICKEFWDNEKCADLFNTVLFKGKQIISPEDLTDLDTDVSSTFDMANSIETMRKSRDIFKRARQGIDFLIFGIENQDEIHYRMPVRTALYDLLCYESQAKDRDAANKKAGVKYTRAEFLSGLGKHDRLNPVITLVIYYGETPWDGPTSIKEMLYDLGADVMELVPDYKMHLLEIRDANNYKFSDPKLELIFDVSEELKKGNIDGITQKYPVEKLTGSEVRFMGYIAKSKILMEKEEREMVMTQALQDWENSNVGLWEG